MRSAAIFTAISVAFARRVLPALLLCAAPAVVWPDALLRAFSVDTPRPFGYAIGDVIEHRATVTLAPGYELLAAALPEAGRIDYYLELAAPQIVKIDDVENRYQLLLRYQIINLQPGIDTLMTPEQRLRYGNGNTTLGVSVPAWSFRVAALADPARPASELRADSAPLLPAVSARPLWLAAAALALGLTGLWYLHGTLPFGRHRSGPFAVALRELAALPDDWRDDASYRRALQTVHAAFDRSAGRALFARDLEPLFAARQPMAARRAPIEAFFRHSHALFFGADSDDTGERYTPQRLRALCRDCRDLERGLVPPG